MHILQHLKKTVWLAVCLLFCIANPHAQTSKDGDLAQATGPHIQVQLVSEYQQLSSGQNWLGVLLLPDALWHTYWRNPGDSGEAPTIEWTLPQGVSAGKIQWPVPKQIKVAHLVNYGYEGSVLLMVPVNISKAYAQNHHDVAIKVDLSWLVCKEDCIPGWATLEKQFAINKTPNPSTFQSYFNDTRQQLPSNQQLSAKYEITEQHIIVALTPPNQSDWQLLPFDSGIIQHNASQQYVENDDGISLVLEKSDYFSQRADSSGRDLQFLLTDGEKGYYVSSQLNKITSEVSADTPLLIVMLMAFVGGLILNLMPCVLPILSIKALGLQSTTHTFPVKLAYAFGVIVSFNLFALAIISLKYSGSAVGWGFHMQSPWIVGLLSYLFIYIALTLFDVAPAGEKLSGIGQRFIQGEGVGSQFATGVLAVIVASPCTAPFMAAALGVALISDPIVTFALFTSLAIGFALPMSLLFWLPGLTRKIPKPGPWMVTFRQFLAFPILGTVIWLVWVYQNQVGSFSQLTLLIGLLVFSLSIWILSKTTRAVPTLIVLSLGVASIVLPLFYQSQPVQTANLSSNKGLAKPFSPAKLDQLKTDGQVVLVNMTADWCITCKVNEQVALNSSELDNVLSKQNVHYLVGDWTNKNQQILDYLQQYQRAGVPLYVVYSGNSGYQVLPQILTTETVINAIEKALGDIQNET